MTSGLALVDLEVHPSLRNDALYNGWDEKTTNTVHATAQISQLSIFARLLYMISKNHGTHSRSLPMKSNLPGPGHDSSSFLSASHTL